MNYEIYFYGKDGNHFSTACVNNPTQINAEIKAHVDYFGSDITFKVFCGDFLQEDYPLNYNDYISNPNSEKWNNSEYNTSVTYEWVKRDGSASGKKEIKVKKLSHAKKIIDFWNSCRDSYFYKIC